MPHIQPTEATLEEQIQFLKRDYIDLKEELTNHERKSLMTFIQKIQCQTVNKYHHLAVLGACYFGLFKIYKSYTFRRPENSALYRVLKKNLNITDFRQIDDYTACTYLSHIYQYLKDVYPDEKNYLEEIKQYNQKIVTKLLKKPPTINALQKNFIQVAKEYKPRESFLGLFGGSDKAVRSKDIEFLHAIENYIKKFFPNEESDEAVAFQVYQIRFAALLYLMAKIENGYSFKSTLYELCQKTLNIKKFNAFPENIKHTYFNILFDFLQKIECNPSGKKLQIYKSYEIRENLKNFASQACTQRLKDYAIEYGMDYGIQIAVGTAAAALIPQCQLVSLIVAASDKVLSPKHAMIIKALTPIVGDQINTCMISIVKIGLCRLVIGPLEKPLIISFKKTTKLIKFLTCAQSKFKNVDDNLKYRHDFYEIIPTLSSDFLSKKQTETLAYIVGPKDVSLKEMQYDLGYSYR